MATILFLVDPCAAQVPARLLRWSGFLLARLGFETKRRFTEALDHEGLRLHHYGILALLAERGPVAQTALAEGVGIDGSHVVALVDALEEAGLAERRADPADRRRHAVTLTRAGRAALDRCEQLAATVEAELLAPLDEAERRELHELLLRIAAHHDARFAAVAER